MKAIAVALCLVFVAQAQSRFLDVDGGEVKFTPHSSCLYNVSANAVLVPKNAGGRWYVDSLYSPHPFTGVTCFDLTAKWQGNNGVGAMTLRYNVVAGAHQVVVDCSTLNTAQAKNDFEGGCFQHHVPGTFGTQYRFAQTDYTSYALVYACSQDQETHKWSDGVAFLARSKDGLKADRRQMLLDLMAQLGWSAAYIRRVPSQSGC